MLLIFFREGCAGRDFPGDLRGTRRRENNFFPAFRFVLGRCFFFLNNFLREEKNLFRTAIIAGSVRSHNYLISDRRNDGEPDQPSLQDGEDADEGEYSQDEHPQTKQPRP